MLEWTNQCICHQTQLNQRKCRCHIPRKVECYYQQIQTYMAILTSRVWKAGQKLNITKDTRHIQKELRNAIYQT